MQYVTGSGFWAARWSIDLVPPGHVSERQLFLLNLSENVTMQACHSDTCHRDYRITKRGGNQLSFLRMKGKFHSVQALASVEKAKSPLGFHRIKINWDLMHRLQMSLFHCSFCQDLSVSHISWPIYLRTHSEYVFNSLYGSYFTA